MPRVTRSTRSSAKVSKSLAQAVTATRTSSRRPKSTSSSRPSQERSIEDNKNPDEEDMEEEEDQDDTQSNDAPITAAKKASVPNASVVTELAGDRLPMDVLASLTKELDRPKQRQRRRNRITDAQGTPKRVKASKIRKVDGFNVVVLPSKARKSVNSRKLIPGTTPSTGLKDPRADATFRPGIPRERSRPLSRFTRPETFRSRATSR
eukprot:TRINITY_DN42036_c0_g1_i1.p2 TRINITY_DN42036_c0_g1~~TRINITY_DN42036_c0_g1_i1.p2  ORF type:complete len:207 (+),score=11.41 TRINITY_DN42036_c0_g1_i1:351-971(+)